MCIKTIYDNNIERVLTVCVPWQNHICGLMFDMVTSTTFEIGILGVIMLNMGIMMFQHYNQEEYYTFALHIFYFNWRYRN